MNNKNQSVFSIAVLVAALGYFVDIYDLLLFTIVREPSLKDLGVNLQDSKEVLAVSTKIINWQMFGLLIGGIVWGVMEIKKEDCLYCLVQSFFIQLPILLQDLCSIQISMLMQDLWQVLVWQGS